MIKNPVAFLIEQGISEAVSPAEGCVVNEGWLFSGGGVLLVAGGMRSS
jgi:hypothetical protein